MSREFGTYNSGYFHDKIRDCANDCREGRDPLTKLWGEFLDEFYDVAYAISTSEACDSGPYDPILVNLNKLKTLQGKFDRIQLFLEDYKKVAYEAVRIHIDIQRKQK